MIEVLFLGTSSATHTKTRNHPGVLLRYENIRILFDCGECIQKQLLYTKESPMSIDYILITHFHGDHVFGLLGMIESMAFMGREKSLTIMGPKGLKKYIEFILDWQKLRPEFDINIHEIGPGKILEEKEFLVTPFKTKHTKESVGFRFQEKDRINLNKEKLREYGLLNNPLCKELKEKGEVIHNGRRITLEEVSVVSKGDSIVYTGDTAPCEEVIEGAKDCTLLIHDGCFDAELKNKAEEYLHSTSVQAAEIAKKANAKYLVLMNISPRYEENDELLLNQAKEVFPNTWVARDFMKLVVKRGEVYESKD